ncbi:MAG: DUF4249 family protein [Bacteroidota bacterium]
MMMKKIQLLKQLQKFYKFSVILFSGLTILGGCTERMDIELDSSYTRLIVYGSITTDTTRHLIKLSKTDDYFSNRPPSLVSGATPVITDDDGNTFILTEEPGQPGFYYTREDVYGIPGRTYTLIIENIDIDEDGNTETYTAVSKMNNIGQVDSMGIEKTDNPFFDMWEIKLYAWDPPETEDFYMFNVYKNDKLLSDTLDEVRLTNDVLFNGNYTYGIGVQFLMELKDDEIPHPGDRFVLEVGSIPRDYFDFLIQLQDETGYYNPLFSGPPANVTTNIEPRDRAVGFFSANSIKRVSMVY